MRKLEKLATQMRFTKRGSNEKINSFFPIAMLDDSNC